MNDFPAFLAIAPGAAVGFVLMGLISRWVMLLVAAFTPGPGPNGDAAPPRSRSARLFAILHPVPWLAIAGLALGVWRLRSGPVGEGWLWFWGAAIATPGVVMILAARMVARARARRTPAP
jgi:hypothetical protein